MFPTNYNCTFYSGFPVHQRMAEDEEMEDMEKEENDDEVEKEENDEEVEEESDEEEEEEDDDSDDETEEEDEDDPERTAWRNVIRRGAKRMDLEKMDSSQKFLEEPQFEQLRDKLQEVIAHQKKRWEAITNSVVYTQIQATARGFKHDDDFEEEESICAAWDKRKFLLRSLVKDNLDVIQKILDAKDEANDEDTSE